MLSELLNHFLRSGIDWMFRRRSTGLALIRGGVVLLIALLAGLTFGFTIPTPDGSITFNWTTSGETSEAISWGVGAVALILIAVGVCLVIRDVRREDRKKVLALEARGLRDWQGTPLVQAVPPSILGRREQVIIDVRQGLVDGQIVDPDTALRRVLSLPDDLARRWSGLDRSDITYVVGGVAPVPFLFLLGVMLDDEGATQFMDWDRHSRMWRQLDADDDLQRFAVSGLDAIPPGIARVALCVSASYDVGAEDVALAEPGVPTVRMDLAGRSTDSHWSEVKQRELGREFLNVVMELAARGTQEISLFLAAPASLALRLGALYDKRNLPSVEVNQYERGATKAFPWAIRMPVSGRQGADVLKR
jgi:hypothetical protein